VEKVEEKSFGSANVMQIISSRDNGQVEKLYLDCKVSFFTRPPKQITPYSLY
jgi:hypothetical protein